MPYGDMFLKLESAKAGAVKGEAMDSVHGGEIDVVDWSWGMSSPHTLSSGGAAQRTALSELKIVKRTDLASTALMAVMRNNDPVTKAVLTVRKAGGKAVDYLVVTIKKGRITQFEIGSQSEELTESLAIAFEEIDVEYKMQDEKGGQKGATHFHASVQSAA
jgi:type VI secretion system secreted protein Hcp